VTESFADLRVTAAIGAIVFSVDDILEYRAYGLAKCGCSKPRPIIVRFVTNT